MTILAGLLATDNDTEEKLYVDDVFSTYVYEGTGAAQDIVNGIDLADEGGMVWLKSRNVATNNFLFDTERGETKYLSSETSEAQRENLQTLTSFNGDGFTIGSLDLINWNTRKYVSWTFRKAPRFFDVIKYTGDGVAGREIAHDLGVAPGMMIVKELAIADAWYTYHKQLGGSSMLMLQDSREKSTPTNDYWDGTDPTDTNFTLGSNSGVNSNGYEYIAYLFAHDPLGVNGDDGMIACGSYTGNGLADGSEIDLGWEPQYLLIKAASRGGGWVLLDSIRGMGSSGITNAELEANQPTEERDKDYIGITATGFKATSSDGDVNSIGETYIYMAIRRPNKPPESADEVFAIDTLGSTGDGKAPGFRSDFPVDMTIDGSTGLDDRVVKARLTGINYLKTAGTFAETYNSINTFDSMVGWYDSTATIASHISYMWKRSPGFFDVVCYDGESSPGTYKHNLSVTPEMVWVKGRDQAYNWSVWHKDFSAINKAMYLNTDSAEVTDSLWRSTYPTVDTFTVENHAFVGQSGWAYIAYLFASLPGISKVGPYTGNGSTQTIDCGFATGARFILIKRTDLAGDWYIWDTLRGIISADDPHLSLNTTAAQVTTDDSVDPDTSGFIVNQVTATNINVLNGEYIFYAIA